MLCLVQTTERGFYYDLTETPFPVCRSNNELLENVRNFDNDKYLKDIDVFFQKLGCYETGKAPEKVVEFIKKDL